MPEDRLRERLARIQAERVGSTRPVGRKCQARSKAVKGSDEFYRCTKQAGHERRGEPQHEDDYGSKWTTNPFQMLVWKGPGRPTS